MDKREEIGKKKKKKKGIIVIIIMYPRLIHPHDGIVTQDELQGGAASNLSHAHKGDPCLVLTADPKPRLRWTQDLHERFVDAVTQLGGASSEFLLTILLCQS